MQKISQYIFNCVGGCSRDHFPFTLSPRGRCARLSSLPSRARTSSFSVPQPTYSRLSFFSPRAFRFSFRLLSHRLALSIRGRCAHHFSRRSVSLSSRLRRLFTRAFPTRSFPTSRCLYKEACLACSLRSFAHSALSLALVSLSLRSRFAQLCSAHGFALLVPRSHLCSSRASPSASSLLVPRLSSLPGSTPLINCKNFYVCPLTFLFKTLATNLKHFLSKAQEKLLKSLENYNKI